ncbi:MAG: EAL domain-containing protein [Methylococcales bacterium]|nr:EAL domain-containing protein [Methylococcaceae bacterium]
MNQAKIFPYFQPIVGIASGKIIGYEALARQVGPQSNIISAGELFSSPHIADQQLIEWDRIVRLQALQKFSESNGTGYLTLNISAKWIDYLSDFNSLPTLLMLEKFNIDRNRIIIEITESKGDLDKLVEVVNVYRKHGLKVAIDDFGAGFSQLERVMAIQPDIIKLDMRLFKEATKGGIASDIVHLLTRLAKRTGCRIVCEGVETAEEFFFGLSCGAQYMQGYLFSPAEADFKDSSHFQEQIGILRKTFLDNTLSREQRKIQYIAKIKTLCEQLKQALESDFNLNHLAAQPFEESGVLRFYLCNNDGEQISSNFNFAQGKWFEDVTQIGFNWAWRPYFYQLLALESEKDGYRLVTSERYRDFNTDVLCKTLSLRLDEKRILLVDIAAEWL